VRLDGRSVFHRPAAEGLLEDLKTAKSAIEKAAVFADEHERGHVLEVYSMAIAVLKQRLR
jgi:hypothetical protein